MRETSNSARQGILGRLGKDPYFGLLLILPLFIWVVATLLYPLIATVELSLQNVGYAGTQGKFIGLRNYANLLRDPEFRRAIWLTLEWTVWGVVLQIGLALGGAVILNQDFYGKEFVRTWIILPWVLPSIVLATLGKWILDPSLGVVNYLLTSLGIIDKAIPFLSTPKYAFWSVMLLNTWRWFPFFAVTLLAALQTIPKELYEAAKIDRANALQTFIHVDLPGIAPVLKIQVLICTLWAANIFDTIWLLTRGGPSGATTTLPILIYYKAFQEFRMSQASTASIIMFLIMLAVSIVYFGTLLKSDWEEQ